MSEPDLLSRIDRLEQVVILLIEHIAQHSKDQTATATLRYILTGEAAK